MTITPGPRRLVGVADDYSKALDQLERRAVRNTRELLRRSLTNTLASLRRSYALYLEALGPMSRDPSGQFIRRPGSYTTAEATAKFRAILADAQRFLPDWELEQWRMQYQADLREATTLGVELAADLTKLQRVPAPAPGMGPTTPEQVQQLGQELVAMAQQPPQAVPFAGVNPEVVRAASLQASAYIQGETARFRDQIVQIVGEGASRGWGPKRLERDIRQALVGARDPNGITKRLGLEQRAELIARSELAAAYSGGTLRTAQQRGIAYVRVLASNDERTCPTCAARNGRVYPVDRVPLPFHPRCVLGDTHVSPGLLAAVLRSRYRGNVVTVGLESGERLTVTANHPMLTPAGWVKAEALRHGDQLVGHGLHRKVPEVAEAPDLHQMPATAEEIFAAFSQAGAVTAMRVPVSPLDLHGDGEFVEGDVDVVRADGLFECYRARNGKPFSQGNGVTGSVRFRPFASLSNADAGLLWHSATANGSMSRLREAEALLRGGLSHAEQHRIATAAWRDPMLAQEGDDGAALDSELSRNSLDAAAFLECPECGSLVKDQAVASERDASLFEVAADHVTGDARVGSDHFDGHAGLVELHKVVSVEINPFHGFVYTFETFSGTYSVGADVRILTRNCRCIAVEVENEAVTEKDPALRATLLDSQRWQDEHDRGVEAYAEARHQERIDVLQRQVDRAKDGDQKDALSAQLQRLVDRGPDMVKARAELAQALRVPTASERRLFGKDAKPLRESVPLFP